MLTHFMKTTSFAFLALLFTYSHAGLNAAYNTSRWKTIHKFQDWLDYQQKLKVYEQKLKEYKNKIAEIEMNNIDVERELAKLKSSEPQEPKEVKEPNRCIHYNKALNNIYEMLADPEFQKIGVKPCKKLRTTKGRLLDNKLFRTRVHEVVIKRGLSGEFSANQTPECPTGNLKWEKALKYYGYIHKKMHSRHQKWMVKQGQKEALANVGNAIMAALKKLFSKKAEPSKFQELQAVVLHLMLEGDEEERVAWAMEDDNEEIRKLNTCKENLEFAKAEEEEVNAFFEQLVKSKTCTNPELMRRIMHIGRLDDQMQKNPRNYRLEGENEDETCTGCSDDEFTKTAEGLWKLERQKPQNDFAETAEPISVRLRRDCMWTRPPNDIIELQNPVASLA